MRYRIAPPLVVVALAFLAPAADRAQDAAGLQDDIPAHVAVVDGIATIERDGRAEPAVSGEPVLAGDRILTGRGRVRVLFGDGSVLELDEASSVDLQSDGLARLLGGRVRITIARDAREVDYRVDTAAGQVAILGPGEYRVELLASQADEPSVDLFVFRGTADLTTARGRTLVRAGARAFADGRRPPSAAVGFNSASEDAFDRWSNLQRANYGSTSARYLPAAAQSYGSVLDRYGSWSVDPVYGSVWYPVVESGWRPYDNGRWTYVAPYGMTWVSFDRWGWPTHHYGRWNIARNRWFWVPDHRWGPAWVAWAEAPGYVGWCPLGFDNRPLVSVTYIQATGLARWLTLPLRAIGLHVGVTRYLVPAYSLAPSIRAAFVVRSHDRIGDDAGRRSVAPIRSPGHDRGTTSHFQLQTSNSEPRETRRPDDRSTTSNFQLHTSNSEPRETRRPDDRSTPGTGVRQDRSATPAARRPDAPPPTRSAVEPTRQATPLGRPTTESSRQVTPPTRTAPPRPERGAPAATATPPARPERVAPPAESKPEQRAVPRRGSDTPPAPPPGHRRGGGGANR